MLRRVCLPSGCLEGNAMSENDYLPLTRIISVLMTFAIISTEISPS